jgi:hypothetical protein
MIKKRAMAAGRQFGKSVLNQMFTFKRPNFVIHTQAQVDGETWYTVGLNKEVCEWLHTQPAELFHEYPGVIWRFSVYEYDIHEKLYTILALRWAP